MNLLIHPTPFSIEISISVGILIIMSYNWDDFFVGEAQKPIPSQGQDEGGREAAKWREGKRAQFRVRRYHGGLFG
jgi:hypothetical protein